MPKMHMKAALVLSPCRSGISPGYYLANHAHIAYSAVYDDTNHVMGLKMDYC